MFLKCKYIANIYFQISDIDIRRIVHFYFMEITINLSIYHSFLNKP